MSDARPTLAGPVEVVGTGLLGTSVALACRRAGLEVLLTDISAEHVRTASALGAGRPRGTEDRPQLVVVAVPPDHLGEAIAGALDAGDAVVTDVGSVKTAPMVKSGRPGMMLPCGCASHSANERLMVPTSPASAEAVS